MKQFVLRKGKKEDFDQVFPLIIMAIEDLANQFTSTSNNEILKERMRAVYNATETRFAKEFAIVIESVEQGKVAGVGFAYPGRVMKHLTQRSLEVCQALGAQYENEDFQRLLDSKEAEDDEFYIDNLAVYEDFRGLGLSKTIISTLEEEGKKQGFDKVSILADINNPKAKAIYEKMGYLADNIYEVLGHNYHHLVKEI